MTDTTEIRGAVPLVADERTIVGALLDVQRAVVRSKLAGLDRDLAAASPVPSGTSVLGMVKHLAYTERWWFRACFAGEDVEFPWTRDDPDAEWRVDDRDTIESILALYDDECDRSRAIAAAAETFDTLAARRHPYRKEPVNLRWVMVHMIEETARHAGHADILRELADGATPY